MTQRSVALVLLASTLVACSSSDSQPMVPPIESSVPSTESSIAASATVSSTSSTFSTSTTSTVSTASTVQRASDFLGEEVIGYSLLGRPIVAMHRGTAGGTVVLVMGVIHGNENAGLAIIEALRTEPLPGGVDLWLVDAINPDGLAADQRGNANGVDLNRNFPHDWTAIAGPGDWEYSGSGPASEPETQAFITFAERISPALTLWYHQDLARISPSTGPDAPLRQRYAERTGLAYASVSGGTYTGVAATWVRRTVPDAMSFIVELGPTLSTGEAAVHAAAVIEIAAMVPN